VVEELIFTGHLDHVSVLAMPLPELLYMFERLASWAARQAKR
jgi:hypothetical protein